MVYDISWLGLPWRLPSLSGCSDPLAASWAGFKRVKCRVCRTQRHIFATYAAAQYSVQEIKIVSCNFHKQTTYHVTVVISEKFLESWLDHFSEVRKSSESGLFSLPKRAHLVLKTEIWDHFYRFNIPPINGKNHHWKVVFSPLEVGKSLKGPFLIQSTWEN